MRYRDLREQEVRVVRGRQTGAVIGVLVTLALMSSVAVGATGAPSGATATRYGATGPHHSATHHAATHHAGPHHTAPHHAGAHHAGPHHTASHHPATATRYAGRTSQRAPISFAISGAHLRKLRFTIYIKCPSRHIWRIGASNFAPIRIKHGRFAQKFVARNGNASASVRGRVLGHRVRGTLYDRTYEPKEGHFCSGTAWFDLAP